MIFSPLSSVPASLSFYAFSGQRQNGIPKLKRLRGRFPVSGIPTVITSEISLVVTYTSPVKFLLFQFPAFLEAYHPEYGTGTACCNPP